MDFGTLTELANNLQYTLSPDRNERKSAELYLRNVESRPTYSVCLLQLLQDNNLHQPTRLAAAITFKNFIKTRWKIDIDGCDPITVNDRDAVRGQILGVLLSVSGSLQQQLSEAISSIWREDFPHKWPNLIPELIQRMALLGADLSMVQGVLQTAHNLFKRYRHECAGNELFTEMKTVIGQFGQPLLELAQNLLALVVVVEPQQRITDANRLSCVLQSLLLVCKIFLSLNCQDLPEFFEDTIADWMNIFHQLLTLDRSVVVSVNGNATNKAALPMDLPGGAALVEQIQSQVCNNASLYASKYETEFSPYLPQFVTDVWEMLVNLGGQTEYDMLIGNAIEFLSSVIAKPQHRQLFENPDTLQKLCEKVILPNMHFRAFDEELFSDNPEEYLRLDLEGSNTHTRRRAACQLVHVLCEAFEGPVVSNFSGYIEMLLGQYASSSNGQDWVSKDAALLLVTSVAARGKTEKHGVTVSTDLVKIPTFYERHVLPELQMADVNHLPVIKADCIRYAITFRGLLPPASLVNLVNLVPQLLTTNVPVVQSYAAVLVDKLLAMKSPSSATDPLITKEQISSPQLLIEKLLAILNLPDSMENVYVMRALMRVCCCLQDRCLPCMNLLVSSLLERLTQVAKNPSRPNFNHFLFETICLCIRIQCASDPTTVTQFETAFFPIFGTVLENDISEFVPYVFQLISVMLEQYPISDSVRTLCGSSVVQNGESSSTQRLRPSTPYGELLPRLLLPILWEQSGNVPALFRLMQSYVLHNMEVILSSDKLSALLGIYQRFIASSTHDTHAFSLLTALVLSTPKDMMLSLGLLRQVFMVIFRRLQAVKTDKFMKAFVCFIARFVLVYSPNELISLVDGIQTGLFARVLEKVLLPYAESVISMPLTLACANSASVSSMTASRVQWRQISIGLIRLIGEAEQMLFADNAVYRDSWAPLVARIVAGLAAGPGKGGEAAATVAVQQQQAAMLNGIGNCRTMGSEERFIEIDSDPTSSSGCCQLTFAVQHLPELVPNIPDPRVYLTRTLRQVSTTYPGKVTAALNASLSGDTALCLKSYLSNAEVTLT